MIKNVLTLYKIFIFISFSYSVPYLILQLFLWDFLMLTLYYLQILYLNSHLLMADEGFFFYYLDTSLVDQECPPYHKSLLASSNIICQSLSLLIILPESSLENCYLYLLIEMQFYLKKYQELGLICKYLFYFLLSFVKYYK